MKVSASIYSAKNRPLTELVQELDSLGIDYFHVDCNDDLSVFDDIRTIGKISDTPVDLHIISPTPEKYFSALESSGVRWVTFQLENLTEPLDFPRNIDAKLGIALSSDTPIEAFEPYKDRAHFVLFMTTTPGQSGGVFRKENFRKIQAFRKQYPGIRIHVDGGVNDENSFILRNMGVDVVVSGSFLVRSETMGKALMEIKIQANDSHYQVCDFMIPVEELPVLHFDEAGFQDVLQAIETYGLGFCLLTSYDGLLEGMISNADVRRGLLARYPDLNNISVAEILNRHPKVVRETRTVSELLSLVKSLPMPVLYLPVVDEQNRLSGALTFNNLIKGES